MPSLFCNSSTIPSSSGCSGPTITKSGFSSSARRNAVSFGLRSLFHSASLRRCFPFRTLSCTRMLSRKHLSIALVLPSFPMTAGIRSCFLICLLPKRLTAGPGWVNDFATPFHVDNLTELNFGHRLSAEPERPPLFPGEDHRICSYLKRASSLETQIL